MDERVTTALTASEPAPEVVVQLLDVVADHDIDHALSDMEQTIARLRASADDAAAARALLLDTPAGVLREALRLRAARFEAARLEAARMGAAQ